ncbi:hypothetical protein [Embleya sp. NBC_00896]|uniref:hypothetical protein n=1 Tax=Embleya sp. NBC_00896 TaxID=2975961 RepID=UPI00386DACEF|nr:hypothetical protein OG928_06630 [Embleya sp. NBC_00896]
MTRIRATLSAAVCVLLGAVLTTGCGVPSTGVLTGGEPASGVPTGMRVYFASDEGLRGVSRPTVEIRDLSSAIKLLIAGPDAAELATGLVTLVYVEGEFHTAVDAGRITLTMPRAHSENPPGQATGQIVCTLSRAESVLRGTRPDAVQVTITTSDGTAGPYQCPQFLTNRAPIRR